MIPHDLEIATFLHNLGAQRSNRGFMYTGHAVELCRHKPELLLVLPRGLYPEIAGICQTTKEAVECGIRRTAGEIWSSHRAEFERLAEQSLPRKPSNSQFLGIVCSHYLWGIGSLPEYK